MENTELDKYGLTKAQKQRAEIAREYFANRKAQTKIIKQRICDRKGDACSW